MKDKIEPRHQIGDVLIFPNIIKYRRLTHFDVDTFIEKVLVKNQHVVLKGLMIVLVVIWRFIEH